MIKKGPIIKFNYVMPGNINCPSLIHDDAEIAHSKEKIKIFHKILNAMNFQPLMQSYLSLVPPRILNDEKSDLIQTLVSAMLLSPTKLPWIKMNNDTSKNENDFWTQAKKANLDHNIPTHEGVILGLLTRLGKYGCHEALTAQFILNQDRLGTVPWPAENDYVTLKSDYFPIWLTDNQTALDECPNAEDPFAHLMARGRGKRIDIHMISMRGFPVSSYILNKNTYPKNAFASFRRCLQTHSFEPSIQKRWHTLTAIMPKGTSAPDTRTAASILGKVIWEFEPIGSSAFLPELLDQKTKEMNLWIDVPLRSNDDLHHCVYELGWHYCHRSNFRIIAIKESEKSPLTDENSFLKVRYLATTISQESLPAEKIWQLYDHECRPKCDYRFLWQLAYQIPRVCYKGKQEKRLRGLGLLLLIANQAYAAINRLAVLKKLDIAQPKNEKGQLLLHKLTHKWYEEFLKTLNVDFKSYPKEGEKPSIHSLPIRPLAYRLAHSCHINTGKVLLPAPLLPKGPAINESMPWLPTNKQTEALLNEIAKEEKIEKEKIAKEEKKTTNN